MKRLFDLLPILLFFSFLRLAQDHGDAAAALATSLLGLWMAGIPVAANEAPVVFAMAATALLTLAQAGWLKWRGQRIEIALWLALALAMLLGAATLYFQGPYLQEWKPSALYWSMGLVFWLSQAIFGWNLPRLLLGGQLQLPALLWHRLNFAWVAFFGLMGLLNLWVAHSFATETWGDFSMFGGIGLVLVFVVAQDLFLGRQFRHGVSAGRASADST